MDEETVKEIIKNSRILIFSSIFKKYEEGLVAEGDGNYKSALNCYQSCVNLVDIDTSGLVSPGNADIYKVALNRARQLILVGGFESPDPTPISDRPVPTPTPIPFPNYTIQNS